MSECEEKIEYCKLTISSVSLVRWLGLRLEFIGAIIIVFVSLLCVITKGHLTIGFAGLILTLANTVTGGKVVTFLLPCDFI